MSKVVVHVFKDSYRDSIQLLKGAADVKKLDGVLNSAFMMGTPANIKLVIDELKGAGVSSIPSDIEKAGPNDLIVSFVVTSDDAGQQALNKAKDLILGGDTGGTSGSDAAVAQAPRHISAGIQQLKGANLALISVPGPYAAAESLKALKKGLHVFLFSDNVSIAEELELKTFAKEKGLFVMGPDCGTAVLDGVPLAFSNVTASGRIGLVGASGTGLQQVSSLIDRLGEGTSQIIGVGGRDLDEQIGGIMMLEGIKRLDSDPATSVIVLVSKPPAPAVAEKILAAVKQSSKPFVVMFQGIKDPKSVEQVGAAVAHSLEDAARLAVSISRGIDTSKVSFPSSASSSIPSLPETQRNVRGLFSGGTFCKEAKLLLETVLPKGSYTVIDLGDDEYTVGRPHPMIDFTLRNEHIVKVAGEATTGVILLDVVLGYGSHEDPAGALLPAIKEAFAVAKKAGRQLVIVGSVCGTDKDPQNLAAQEKKLAEAGVILTPTNAQAVRLAASISTGKTISAPQPSYPSSVKKPPTATGQSKILGDGVKAVNIGLASFAEPIPKHGGQVIHLDWRPPAAADKELGLALARLYDDTKGIGKLISDANAEAVKKLTAAHPFLVDVQIASDVLPNLGKRTILHSGPPVTWERMCGPQRGAVIGGILFEGWAKDEQSAIKMAESGEVTFAPCHHYGAVGPMAGIISPSMPVFVVENTKHGNKTFSNMNEGLGKVLRFGAYDSSVLDRLKWMRTELAPVLQKTLKSTGPIDLKFIWAQALQMGDECHNRNAAATLLFSQQITGALVGAVDKPLAVSVLSFLSKNAHFFLNLSMAASKAILDSASNIPGSSVVTVMARNGTDFGIRLSGTGDKWFTTTSPLVNGLYFPGYGSEDANPDMGDSSITETAGIGGFAMAAAPAIVGFVGGTAADAIANTKEMYEICLARNQDLRIPGLDFAGVPIAIDARKVLETGIGPVINTGIAHKKPGIGQIGAGITRAPLSVFGPAVRELESSLRTQKRSYTTATAAATIRPVITPSMFSRGLVTALRTIR